MDLSLDVGDYKLNIRAAGMFVHNNKILVHKDDRKDHCCLPGGRIEIGENSEETIKREIKEELGKEIEIIDRYTFMFFKTIFIIDSRPVVR